MQTALATSFAKAPVATRTAVAVVCRAQQQQKAAAALAAVPALLAASPAFALVDDRIATEGTGLALGVHDPALFFAIAIVFTGVWAVFYSGAKSLGGGKGDDSGLTL
ncbi:hypothetical protein N2152v2_006121 [Parachlorella kessleri]